MLSAVLFLVAACAKTSFGHSVVVSTRDLKIYASNSNEYSTIPEDFDSKRRLRGAVNNINRIKERDAAILSEILGWNINSKLSKNFQRWKKMNPRVMENDLFKIPETYKRLLEFTKSLSKKAATKPVSFETLNLLGVRPQQLKERIPSRTALKRKGKVDRYKNYLNTAFYNPVRRNKPLDTSRLDDGKFEQAFRKLYNDNVLELLKTAFFNIVDVEKLAALASGPVYRQALEANPKYKEMMSSIPLERWPENSILKKLIAIHEFFLKTDD
ncbi:hypothetical protein CCR75_002583 [Bremia lactucae]|uniref:RxLR effector protein n=1 Tax=Bremia lactucae TaxID=4779 RepID=A0A976IL38_BRELC|nr:hypothetical protein CCR75_002583 [Bremia lactucae]